MIDWSNTLCAFSKMGFGYRKRTFVKAPLSYQSCHERLCEVYIKERRDNFAYLPKLFIYEAAHLREVSRGFLLSSPNCMLKLNLFDIIHMTKQFCKLLQIHKDNCSFHWFNYVHKGQSSVKAERCPGSADCP